MDNCAHFKPTEIEMEENGDALVMENLDNLVSSPYALECLILGTHLTPAHKTSIQIIRAAFSCVC